MQKNASNKTSEIPTGRAPTAARLHKEAAILKEAENQFAQFGFEGASLESIGAALGISRHNLLYYFPSKEALYRSVLDSVMDQWLSGMDELTRSEDPTEALRSYIGLKLHFSRERPNGVKVFTKEVIAGAPRYGDVIATRVTPKLKQGIRTFERWAREGRIARVNFFHLMFIIWATTQAYAEQQTQFALLMGKKELSTTDFNNAQTLILRLVCDGLALRPDRDAPSA